MLADVGPVQILDLPHKWSDHAALFVSIGSVKPPPPHEPVPESSKKMKQFTRQKQRSIASMFASKLSSPKASKTALPDLTVSQPVASADSVSKRGGQQDLAVVSKAHLTELQEAEILPEPKRQRLEASDGDGRMKGGLGEAANERCRADSSGPNEPSHAQTSAQLPVKGKKAIASKAIKNSAEQAKRESGQQNIKAFFTKTA